MEEMKEIIGGKIAEAREQRGLKQSDLADYLGLKSSQAVSEIERGKVNISAADLYKLANLLNKPIMYFYDEDFGGKRIDDVIVMIKNLSDEELDELVASAKDNTRLKILIGSLPEGNDLDPLEHKEFIENFISELLDIKRPLEAKLKSLDFIISQFEDLISGAKSAN